MRGQPLEIAGEPAVRPLQPSATLYSRNVALNADDEDAFLRAAAKLLEELDILVRKMLPGKITMIDTPDGPLATHSLMQPPWVALPVSRHLGSRGSQGTNLRARLRRLASSPLRPVAR